MDNRRVILAVSLSIGVLLVWNWLFPPTQQVVVPQQTAQTRQAQEPARQATIAPSASGQHQQAVSSEAGESAPVSPAVTFTPTKGGV